MKLKSKILALAVCAFLLLSACSSKSGTSSESAGSGNSQTATADKTGSDSTATGNGSKELIDVNLVKQSSAYVQGNLDKIGETYQKNRWNDLIAKELGYNIVYKWIVADSDAYSQKFNAAIASGDLPDIVRVNNVQLKNLVDAGLLADLTKPYNELATPLTKKLITGTGTAPIDAATFNGSIYGIPIVDADIERSHLLWVRTDWLKKTGKEMPKTMDDLVELAKAFKEIAGKGAVALALQKDPIGMGSNFTINGFMNGYGAYPGMWILKDGKVVYGNTTAEFRKGLTKLAEMYKMGLIDKEFTVKDANKVAEDIVAGKNGLFYAIHAAPLWPLQDAVNKMPEADYLPAFLPSEDGTGAAPGVELATTEWYAASKKSKAPEAVVKIMNLYDDLYFDPQKQNYQYYAAPGNGIDAIWAVSPEFQFGSSKNGDIAKLIAPHLESGDPGDLFGEALAMYQYSLAGQNSDRSNWGWNRIYGKGGAKEFQNQYVDNNKFVRDIFYGAPTETMATNKTILDNAFNEAVVKTISGQISIDDFDKAVKAWFDGGGTKMTEEVNAWYQQNKK